MNKVPKFWRSVGLSLSGMAAAQSIPLLASLILTRIYTPTEFGLFSTWLGVVMIATVIVTGRFEVALATVQDGEPRKAAMKATLATIGIACALLSILVMAFYSTIPALHEVPRTLLLLFIPATLIAATIQTWQAWAAAEGLYRKLAWIRIAQALGVSSGQIALGWFTTPTAVEMSLGYFLGIVGSLCVAVYAMPINFSSSINISKSLDSLTNHWIRYRRFPLFALPADSTNSVSGQIPLLIIASQFGAEASGLYALTTRVLGAPIGLLGTAVLDVFKRSAAASYREKGHCRKEYLHTLLILTIGGVLLAISVILIAEPLFVFAFGEPWRKAGIISAWLMPMFALRFVASPLSYVFYIADKQHIDLIWQCALLGMTIVAFLLPSSFEQSVKMYAIGYGCLYIVYLALSYRYSKGHTA